MASQCRDQFQPDAGNVVPPSPLHERTSNEAWTCTATAHEGGIGSGRGADPCLHFNTGAERHAGRRGRSNERPGHRLASRRIKGRRGRRPHFRRRA